MNLGVLVNREKNLPHILGIVAAAAARGHAVTIFAMDEGTRLLADSRFTGLAEMEGVAMSYCDHSAQEFAVPTDMLPAVIEASSQYNNAAMHHKADKVIVL